MSRAVSSRRGRPLAVYAAIVAGWIAVRLLTWELPFDEPLLAKPAAEAPVVANTSEGEERASAEVPFREKGEDDKSKFDGQNALPAWSIPTPLDPIEPQARGSAPLAAQHEVEFTGEQVAAGHQLLWMAAMSRLPVPKGIHAIQQSRPDPWFARNEQRPNRKRWSLDAWIFLREGSGDLASGTGLRPSYGASQEGAVVRYSLAGNSGRDLSAYARFTKALAGARETDLAAGLVAKPVKSLPLWLHGEMRVTRVGGTTDYRPTAFATTQVQRALPGKLELRAYAQGGFVGGDFATAFADGQLVADREVTSFDLGKAMSGKVRVGAGIWGGAQKGAQRLDVGPSANVVVPVADAPVRLSVDYRIRAAGDAEPRSGVAVTLSSGF